MPHWTNGTSTLDHGFDEGAKIDLWNEEARGRRGPHPPPTTPDRQSLMPFDLSRPSIWRSPGRWIAAMNKEYVPFDAVKCLRRRWWSVYCDC